MYESNHGRRWNLTLRSTVPHATSLVRPGWPGCAMHTVKLAVLPTPHTEQKSHNIALLLAVQLLHILVCTHLDLEENNLKFEK